MCAIFFTKILRNRIVHAFLKITFSNLGLCFLVTLYCVAGALIFQRVEGKVERAAKQAGYEATVEVEYRQENLKLKLIAFVDDCYKLQNNQTVDVGDNVTEETCRSENAVEAIAKMLDEYKMFVLRMKEESGGVYRGVEKSNDTTTLDDWSLPSGILFTASILGTIGYGNVVPKSEMGQLTVVLYAVFAIPLMSMFLFKIGNGLGNGARWLYHKVSCSKRKAQNKQWASRVSPVQAARVSQRSPVVKMEENNSRGKLARDKQKTGESQVRENMPIGVVMAMGLLYIVVGMLLFYGTEKWSMVESLYFTFVSLATIGFGDYVPSARAQSVADQARLIMTTIYLFVGLAIFAMCISLLVDTIKNYKSKLSNLMSKVATKVQRA